MNVRIEDSWKEVLANEFEADYFRSLISFVKEEYRTHQVFPPGKDIFAAFDRCSVESIKVMIIGQDPYHGNGQANGFCFSVADGVKIPPSLSNIYKELENDIGKARPSSGNLEHWADQGILLLNATLTVRANSPGSHQKRGWEQFTDAVIKKVSDQKQNIVFILWGAYAQKKQALIDESKHMIIKSPHPSPFSAHTGFFGSKPFSKTNEYLQEIGSTEILW